MSPGWLRRLLAGADPGTVTTRTTGRPRSSNGASSFHLGWVVSGVFDAVAVTLEVLEPPVVDRLYFWALQADFGATGRSAGGAHLGLQWHPQHPGSTAVNWGGYRAGGGELDGSASALPSRLANVNTRDFSWTPGTPYRLAISRNPADESVPRGMTAWRGTVCDLSTGAVTVVRDLYIPGDRIVGATMWSEVFADCDAPSVAVRWSDPVVVRDGVEVEPSGLSVNYQTHGDGGCANTSSGTDGIGVLQRTSTDRLTSQGTRLSLR